MEISENGEPLPGYRLKRFLGRGGFGEAWEANAPGDVPIAIKFIQLGQSLSEVDQRELEILRTVRHAHLLDLHFVHEIDGYLLMGMPLCDQDLVGRLTICQKQGLPGIPRQELLELMEEAAKALDFLHGHNVIHRDIKPHNIFLVGGTVKVADFGLAKVLQQTLASQSGHRFTPAYVAPEIAQGKAAKASDQYSLALTYCQLRTGKLPIEAEDVLALILAHIQQPPNLKAYDPQEARVLERALAKSPAERWPSCRDFVQALKTGQEATPTIPWDSSFEIGEQPGQDPIRGTPAKPGLVFLCPHCGGSDFKRIRGIKGVRYRDVFFFLGSAIILYVLARNLKISIPQAMFLVIYWMGPGFIYWWWKRQPLLRCEDCDEKC